MSIDDNLKAVDLMRFLEIKKEYKVGDVKEVIEKYHLIRDNLMELTPDQSPAYYTQTALQRTDNYFKANYKVEK